MNSKEEMIKSLRGSLKSKKQLIFRIFRAPGDCLVFTNLIRDFYEQFSDTYEIDVLTPFPEIFYLNPRLIKLPKNNNIDLIDFTNIDMNYFRKAGFHYSTSYIEYMNGFLNNGSRIKQTSIIPEIFLSDQEKDRDYILSKYDITDKFWIFNSGIKIDMPLKSYPVMYWDYAIKELQRLNINIVQVGSIRDIHPEFTNIKSLLGKTENLRDFLSLAYHAEGAISHVSMLMHIMAAYNKPCIVLGGNRENVRWEYYEGQYYFHSMGFLDCSKDSGCWLRQRTECINMSKDIKYPKCMTLINPDYIVETVMKYEGRL